MIFLFGFDQFHLALLNTAIGIIAINIRGIGEGGGGGGGGGEGRSGGSVRNSLIPKFSK